MEQVVASEDKSLAEMAQDLGLGTISPTLT